MNLPFVQLFTQLIASALLYTGGFQFIVLPKLFTKLTLFVHQIHTDFYSKLWYNGSKTQKQIKR
jgi:hypothetical protein